MRIRITLSGWMDALLWKCSRKYRTALTMARLGVK